MRVGILTGGGDCPGLNAVIRAIVRKGVDQYGDELIGIRNGWAGLIEDKMGSLGKDQISGILPKGGTILGTSRTNPFKIEGGLEKILKTMKDLRNADVDFLTIGQYLQPSRNHTEIKKYYTPMEFEELKKIALKMGFEHVESGPLVRSSYHAEKAIC